MPPASAWTHLRLRSPPLMATVLAHLQTVRPEGIFNLALRQRGGRQSCFAKVLFCSAFAHWVMKSLRVMPVMLRSIMQFTWYTNAEVGLVSAN